MIKISFQPDLRPLLPTFFGSKDYHDSRDTLTQMDRIIPLSQPWKSHSAQSGTR